MKKRIVWIATQCLALFLLISTAQAQVVDDEQASYSQPELEQILAPIALYPDPLLSHVLMAATYPTEVVEASYWLRAHPAIRGESAIRATQNMQWDISVKSLLPFPHLLETMASRYDWTQNLGNAFLGQQAQVMDTVQVLRHRAMATGHLHSDMRISVMRNGSLITIMPARSTLVYLPYYNPNIVYGRWSQPAYPPVYWAAWPGYYAPSHYAGWAWRSGATIVRTGIFLPYSTGHIIMFIKALK